MTANTATGKQTDVKQVRVISVTSGKGGVGKTNIAVALAIEFNRLGNRVLIIDADLGLANMDIVLGVQPKYNLMHVLEGQQSLTDVIIKSQHGVHLIPAGSGISEIDVLTPEQRLILINEVDNLEDQFDVLLIDTGAGISPNVLYFNSAANEVIIVITPEPTSVADAYAMIKLLYLYRGITRFNLLMNQVESRQEAMSLFKRVAQVTERFLHLSLDYLGHVIKDDHIHRSVMHKEPFIIRFPNAPASRCIAEVAKRLSSHLPPTEVDGGIKFFLRKIIEGSTGTFPEGAS